jgi:hypothetical protein
LAPIIEALEKEVGLDRERGYKGIQEARVSGKKEDQAEKDYKGPRERGGRPGRRGPGRDRQGIQEES